MSLTILIPCYNEAHRIRENLLELKRWYRSAPMPVSFLFVDDGSTDATSQLIQASGLEARIIRLDTNLGKGGAIAAGIGQVRTDWVLIMDADLSTALECIDQFWRYTRKEDCDIAVANRFHPLSRVQRSLLRGVTSYLFFFCVHSLMRFSTFDTQCGFKLFKKEAAVKLFKDLSCQRYSFDFEVLLRAEGTCKICELPIKWVEKSGSSMKILRDGKMMVMDLLRLRGRR